MLAGARGPPCTARGAESTPFTSHPLKAPLLASEVSSSWEGWAGSNVPSLISVMTWETSLQCDPHTPRGSRESAEPGNSTEPEKVCVLKLF